MKWCVLVGLDDHGYFETSHVYEADTAEDAEEKYYAEVTSFFPSKHYCGTVVSVDPCDEKGDE